LKTILECYILHVHGSPIEEVDFSHRLLVTRSNSNGISKVTLIENESQLKLIKQHLGIDNSDIYLSPYVIFVEGDSEEISVPIVAKALGFSQIGKEVRIINLKGKDKIQRLTEFLKYITYFGTEAIVIADGHKSTNDRIEDLKRSKLNFHPLIRGKDKEFEDLFNSKIIVEAMKNLSLKKSLKFEMNEDELENKRKATNVARILEQYMRDNNNGIELDKKSLAGELSSITIKEMNKKEPNREKTGLEKEIEYVMNIIYPHNK
jgi:predicted ATP-dependent endonuclease of OLD family